MAPGTPPTPVPSSRRAPVRPHNRPMERIPESCTDVQAALPLYVGSDLEPTEQSAVAAHLAGCAGCSRLAASAQRAREVLWTLRDQEEVGPAPHLWGGIRARLVSEGLLKLAPDGDEPGRELSRPAPAGPRTGWRWRTVQVGGLAAAAALALVFGLQDRAPDPTTPGPAQGEPAGLVRSDPVTGGAVRLVADRLRHVGSDGTPLLLEAREFPAAVFPVGVGRGSVNALTGSESPARRTWRNNRRDPRLR